MFFFVKFVSYLVVSSNAYGQWINRLIFSLAQKKRLFSIFETVKINIHHQVIARLRLVATKHTIVSVFEEKEINSSYKRIFFSVMFVLFSLLKIIVVVLLLTLIITEMFTIKIELSGKVCFVSTIDIQYSIILTISFFRQVFSILLHSFLLDFDHFMVILFLRSEIITWVRLI